jgi:hypothetical protein
VKNECHAIGTGRILAAKIEIEAELKVGAQIDALVRHQCASLARRVLGQSVNVARGIVGGVSIPAHATARARNGDGHGDGNWWWFANLNLSSILEYGCKCVYLDLLQVAQATRGGREPEVGKLGASKVGVSEVASQRRSLFAIKRIAQRLQGSVP